MALACVVYKKNVNVAERLAKRAESLRKKSGSHSTLKKRNKNNGLVMKKFAKDSGGNFFPATPLKLVNIWPICLK